MGRLYGFPFRRGSVRGFPERPVHLFPVLNQFTVEPVGANLVSPPSENQFKVHASAASKSKNLTVANWSFRLPAFFTAAILLAFVVDYGISIGLRRIKTSDFGISNQLVAGQINGEILISGSSRAVCHYDPELIQDVTGLRTFNIGRNGSQTDMQVAILKTYLRHNANPKLLIHNLDSFSFLTTKEIYDPAQYLPYLTEPDIYGALQRISPGIWKSRFIPMYGYAVDDMRFTWLTGFAGLIGWQSKETLHQGFRPDPRTWTGDFEKFKADNINGVRFPMEPEGIKDLMEIMAICKNRDIPLLLVYSPVYYEMQALELDRAEFFARCRDLSNKFGAMIWDYSDSPLCLKRENFYNSQHLNKYGARLFCLDIASRLAAEKPWRSTVSTAGSN
jgi:hypothetical protein